MVLWYYPRVKYFRTIDPKTQPCNNDFIMPDLTTQLLRGRRIRTQKSIKPTDDGPEVGIIRHFHNRAEAFYQNEIHVARFAHYLENLHIVNVEIEFLSKMGVL